jgi:regulator of protease activity HflC (stomatin/prohibitin superfamily)
MKNVKKIIVTAVVGLSLMGCMKPYDKPEYVTVETDETAFVLPLEGDTGSQAKFASAKFLEEHKVAEKRIQISHRWSQTGRMNDDGEWIGTAKVIKVKRAPITREWTAEGKTGTAAQDQAIWVESQDSVGFSMGFTVTAYIKEEDTATFLYWYPAGSLADVMDKEVRARVQKSVGEVAARYPLDQLRTKKAEMQDAAVKDVTDFFKNRGITVTTVAMFGGMTYENKAIQEAIDKTFIAQQEKVNSAAAFDAQQKKNDTIALAAEGEAKAILTRRKAEADGIRMVNEATQAVGPNYLSLKQLDIEQTRLERWNGQYPTYYMGSGLGLSEKPTLLLSVPAPATAPSAPSAAAQTAAKNPK